MWRTWCLCSWDLYSKFISYSQCNAMLYVPYSLWVVMGFLDQIKELIIVDDVMLLKESVCMFFVILRGQINQKMVCVWL